MKANNRGPALFDAGLSTKKGVCAHEFPECGHPRQKRAGAGQGLCAPGPVLQKLPEGRGEALCIAVERSGGQIGTYETKIYGTPEMEQADAYYVDRLVKFLLWSWAASR
jgi:hypothetical protein